MELRILQSKGRSFTALTPESDKLERGLKLEDEENKRITPQRMAEYLRTDPDLVIRQVVSVLDKVVRKTNKLRDLPIEAYVDRTLLAEELWVRVRGLISQSDEGKLTQAELDGYKSSWSWKVHPYAQLPADPNSPLNDKNAAVIRKYADKVRSPLDARGRWHSTLWKTTADGKADYAATADAIILHLFSHEARIGSGSGPDQQRVGEVGLVERRGKSIQASAPKLELPSGPAGSSGQPDSLDERIVDLFFHQDIAAQIHDFATSRVKVDGAKKANAAPSVRSADFGRMLSEHFGNVPNHRDFDGDTKQKIVAFYDRVKRHYRDIVKSERFRRAVARAEINNVGKVLPRDKAQLLAVLQGRKRNSDFSSLIRFGKLVAHATDMPDGLDAQAEFDKRLRDLATSDGLSEIKRNENFTRAWRTSVAFSLRTLDRWMRPDWKQLMDAAAKAKGSRSSETADREEIELDLTQTEANKAIAQAGKHEGFFGSLKLLFGARVLEFENGESARHSVFSAGSPEENCELVWAWLRLAAEMRHRTNHFNTKQRLISLTQTGILSVTQDKPRDFRNRGGNKVQQSALDAFARLLNFDIDHHALMLVSDFNRLGVTRFADDDQTRDLLKRCLGNDDDLVITTPKFMSVLRKANGIYEQDHKAAPPWAKGLGKLDLTALSQAPDGPNQFRIGVLRHLYATDFESWLALEANSPEHIRSAVTAVAEDKKRRTLEVLQTEETRVYAVAETAANMLTFSKADSFRELASMVMETAFAEDNTRKSYKPKPEEQSKKSTWVDDFMRDLFVYLFDTYLHSKGLSWILEATDLLGEGKPRAITLAELQGRKWSIAIKPWHSQFYAWLYLVPVDEVALLRNQMRRMLILEEKGGSATTTALRDIDRLMTLYISVGAAGFDGTEHASVSETGRREVFQLDGKLFYEDADLFERVFSAEADTNEHSLPGTRRGLRQIARLGHTVVLNDIFEKHRITSKEVEALQAARKEQNFKDATRRAKLHKDIVKLAKGIKPDLRKLHDLAAEYERLSVDITRHNFRANGARLTEHARLHQFMMRVISRLTDFTLIWERDRNYVLLAMIYPKLLHPKEKIPRFERRKGRLGFVLPSDAAKEMQKAYATLTDKDRGFTKAHAAIGSEDIKNGFLPLWDDRKGYRLTGYAVHLALLDEDQKASFVRFFDTSEAENPLDVAERNRIIQENGDYPPRQRHQLTYHHGKRRIRNDFAHFNVIAADRKRVNLTYLMNAVRSLMAYDRKLKNAVSKAITDIVVDEGLDIRWEMAGDRLRHALVIPRLEMNLKAVRRHDGFDPAFVLPLASIRYTSMVQALFDFQSGGHRQEIKVGLETKQRGPLGYPRELQLTVQGLGARLPNAVLNEELPEILAQK